MPFYRSGNEVLLSPGVNFKGEESLPGLGLKRGWKCEPLRPFPSAQGPDASAQHVSSFFPRVRTPCGRCAQVIIEG